MLDDTHLLALAIDRLAGPLSGHIKAYWECRSESKMKQESKHVYLAAKKKCRASLVTIDCLRMRQPGRRGRQQVLHVRSSYLFFG